MLSARKRIAVFSPSSSAPATPRKPHSASSQAAASTPRSRRSQSAGNSTDLLRWTLEADLPENILLPEMRDRLARHVLLTDLVAGLGESLPASLNSLKITASPAQRDACVTLARTWRLRRDIRDRLCHRSPKGRAGSRPGTGRFHRRYVRPEGRKGVRNEWHSEIRKSIAQLGIDRYRPPWVKDW